MEAENGKRLKLEGFLLVRTAQRRKHVRCAGCLISSEDLGLSMSVAGGEPLRLIKLSVEDRCWIEIPK